MNSSSAKELRNVSTTFASASLFPIRFPLLLLFSFSLILNFAFFINFFLLLFAIGLVGRALASGLIKLT